MNAPFRNAADAIESLRLLKIEEVARLTSLHRATIYRLIAAGTFPAQIRLSRYRVGWRASEIEAWIEQHKT